MIRIKKLLNTIIDRALRQTQWENAILRMAENNANASLLSLGCTGGEYTQLVAERIGTKNVSAIEIVPQYVELAKNRGINVVLGDLNEPFIFQNSSFDVILSNHDIEHLSNTDSLVSECYRTLKNGGYLIISTPNLSAFSNIAFLMVGRQPFMAEVSEKIVVGTWSRPKLRINPSEPGHRRLFTAPALIQLLEWNGFKVEKIVRSDFRPFPKYLAAILVRLFPIYASSITIKARKIETLYQPDG
jgi:SAM-dependent methyltransferase